MWQLTHKEYLLLLVIPIGILLFFLFKQKNRTLSTHLKLSQNADFLKKKSRRTKNILRLLFLCQLTAISLLVFVICEPFELKTWAQKWTEGVDIVICLDVSESMDATDLNPNRILAAKQVIREFIKSRPNDRIGIVIFGGESILKSPLTRDFDFLNAQVEDIKLRELKQGTAIGMGLSNSIARLRKTESKNKVIILLTDGDSNVGSINPITASNLAAQEGIRIYSIGIGQSDRVLVPIYSYDLDGRKTQLIAQVPSYLNPKLLEEIAHITKAKSFMARDTNGLHKILQEIDSLEKTRIKVKPMAEKQDRFLLPALIASLLLFLSILLQETRFQQGRLKNAISV